LSKMSRRIKTWQDRSPGHPGPSKPSRLWKPQLQPLLKPNQARNTRYLNMLPETSAGDILRLSTQCPSRTYSSTMFKRTNRETKCWVRKSPRLSHKTYTWHNKLPGHMRHPQKNSRRTPSWAWSHGRWPPTCSRNI